MEQAKKKAGGARAMQVAAGPGSDGPPIATDLPATAEAAVVGPSAGTPVASFATDPEERIQGDDRAENVAAEAARAFVHVLIRLWTALLWTLRSASMGIRAASAEPLFAVVRPVVPAAGSASLPAAPPRHVIVPTVDDLDNQAPSELHTTEDAAGGGVAAATQTAATTLPGMSVLSAAAEPMAEDPQDRQMMLLWLREQENDCVICLDRPVSTVLKPCGHEHMCQRCCKKLFALSISKRVEPLVRDA